MTQLAETKASQRARANFIANGRRQEELPRDVEFVFGRDGSLTARESEAWWTGCSVPHRAACAQLKALDVQGPVACFLAPPHSAAIRVALDKMRPEQAIIAIVPSALDVDLMLACEDFSGAIAANRLWFVTTDEWTTQLDGLFERQPGLSIPSQFIRLNTIDPELSDSMIRSAQAVFGTVTTRRSELISRIRTSPRAIRPEKLCIVAGRAFRLWSDWGETLAHACADDDNLTILNPDEPTCASPLAVSQASTHCAAIVTIDVGRADAMNVVADDLPWITWCATGRIPVRTSPADHLILVDPSDHAIALDLGWTETQLHSSQPPAALRGAPASHAIALIADTVSLEPPASIDDFSSHRPLWESIAAELSANPFAIGADVNGYLSARMKRFDVGDETLDRAAIIARLIVPAYTQGVARALLAAKLDVEFWGSGWESCDGFSHRHRSAIDTRATLDAAIDGAHTLVHAFPSLRVHPIDFAGRPVVRAFEHRTGASLIRAFQSPRECTPIDAPSISLEFIRSIVPRTVS